jgi:hypothetical protein
MERHASYPSAPPRHVVPLQELALKLLQPLAGALAGDGASTASARAPLAALAGLAPPALSLREALTFAVPGPEEPLALADHQVYADSTKADRAYAPFASFARAPAGAADGSSAAASKYWCSRQRPAGVAKTSVTVTFAAAADVTGVVLELPQDAKAHCEFVGVELLPAPRPRMPAADIATAVSTASLAAGANPSAAASMASLMLPAAAAVGAGGRRACVPPDGGAGARAGGHAGRHRRAPDAQGLRARQRRPAARAGAVCGACVYCVTGGDFAQRCRRRRCRLWARRHPR